MSRLATDVLRQAVPEEFENTKRWGGTKEVGSGVDVYRAEDGRLKTRRRTKEVKHGRWSMYRVKLVDTEKNLEVSIERLQEVRPGVLGCEVVVVAHLEVFARVAKWVRNVRLFSASGDALAKVRLAMDVELSTRLDATRLPPELLVDVSVRGARAELLEFELQHLGELHGDLVEGAGKLLREVIEDELVDQQPKLVEKINTKIAKQQEQGGLRLSLQSLVPEALRKALDTNVGDAEPRP